MCSETSKAADILLKSSYSYLKSNRSRQQSPRVVLAQEKNPLVSCGPFTKNCQHHIFGEKLALELTCMQIWSRPKWVQVIASQLKCNQGLAKVSRNYPIFQLASTFDFVSSGLKDPSWHALRSCSVDICGTGSWRIGNRLGWAFKLDIDAMEMLMVTSSSFNSTGFFTCK